MPLTITGASANWGLAAQVAAPTAARIAGAGGGAQANATSLILANASASWNLLPLIPTTAQLNATSGPTQSNANALIIVSAAASWNITNRLLQPGIGVQRGAGGGTQANATGLIVVGAATSWNLAARILAASFTFTIAPDGFSVLFTSTSGDAPDSSAWDFGDGNSGSGAGPTHIYADIAPFTVTLTVTRTRGFEVAPISSRISRIVTIVATAQPDESMDDVLNLEVGFHAYEPLRNQSADIGENVSFYNGVVNLPAGQLASLLFFAPSQTIRVRQVTATGTGDGLFKLLLNGQVIEVKRSYATQRNVRFDIEDELKLTVNDSLEVQVTNTSSASQSYDGAVLGRTL